MSHMHAERLYRQALAIHAEVGNRRNEGANTCAYCRLRRGEHETAKATWRRGIASLRAINDQVTIERAVGNMRRNCDAANTPPFE
jgi:hypothetical protein